MTAPTIEPAALTDPPRFAEGDPHGPWRWMRDHTPAHRHPPGEQEPIMRPPAAAASSAPPETGSTAWPGRRPAAPVSTAGAHALL
ncbi:hypothetical protein ACIBEJ_02665 [Nonomuraea sp. NPDC050790]|uniref:hypothetical protein n=1 Tax=Nonomuraea sp. NPDC050790 TaxID=3364371 RepID=UPI0037B05178